MAIKKDKVLERTKDKVFKKPEEANQQENREVQITAPNFRVAEFKIKGTTPYVQLRFFKKGEIQIAHEQGGVSKSKKKREARDFKNEYEQAKHVSEEGWVGIPAASFRNAMISACRIVSFKMTLAKLSVFADADGLDREEGTPLIKIKGTPEMVIHHVRNQTGVVDLRSRAMWREWSATVRIKFDADLFSLQDVTNLMCRVGQQVGIGEGRPDGKTSAGMGWGLFEVENLGIGI